MTNDQKEFMAWASNQPGGYFTTAEAVRQFGGRYYSNSSKYVGERLSRMVEAKLIERTAPGKYKIGKGKKSNPATADANQSKLF